MDTDQERQHSHTHLFTLRLWEEALGEGKVEWRGRVQEIVTGETAFFRDWLGLVATLKRLTSTLAEVHKDMPAGPQHADGEGS